jgi:putative flippase GtrA
MQAFNIYSFVLKFFRFSLVGIMGMGIDFGTTYVLKEYLRVQKYVANALGFTLAASSNYFLNKWWTFQDASPHITEQFIKFFIVSLLGLAINTYIIYLLTNKFKKNFYLSKLFAIGVVVIWNFSINLLFTFK